MKNLVIVLTVVLVLLGIYSFKSAYLETAGSAATGSGINWMTWEQMMEKSKTEPRKVVVDVYTDWCGWCKRMDQTTFKEPQIARYVNEKYYAVKFNAEQKDDISYKDQTYKFKQEGMKGCHELIVKLIGRKPSYPTLIFLDEKQEVIQSIPGYRESLEFETIITYFAKNEYKKTPWETYQKVYKPMGKN